MKLALTLTAALIGGVALPVVAFGGPFGLPDNELDGYRGTGCDPAYQVQITNADGEYLYSNNPTCTKRGNGSAEFVFVTPEPPEESEEPGDDDEGPGDDDDAGEGEGGGKDGCNGKKCNPATGGGNSEGNENSDQDGD